MLALSLCINMQQALAETVEDLRKQALIERVENLRKQPFNQEKLIAVYIPDDLFMKDGYSHSLSVIIYDGHSIVIDSNEVLHACRNTFVYGKEVYKKLPKGCQFMIDLITAKYVCGVQGCIKAPYYDLVDVETGEEQPVNFNKYKK